MLITTSALFLALSATTPVMASVTRTCGWTLYVNTTATMFGTANGTAGTVYLARLEASNKILDCFQKAKSTHGVPYCSGVNGWNKSFISMLPEAKGTYEYKVTVHKTNGKGCSRSRSFYLVRTN